MSLSEGLAFLNLDCTFLFAAVVWSGSRDHYEWRTSDELGWAVTHYLSDLFCYLKSTTLKIVALLEVCKQ